MAKEITEKEYEELVINTKGRVIVDFYSTECPPCEALAPKFEFFNNLYGDEVTFYKVFRQGNRDLSLELGVKSSPTLLFYEDGKEIAPRQSGAVKKSVIKETIVSGYGLPDKTAGTKRETSHYDLVIIGAGPAGLTAGLYAGRAKINTLLIDQGNPGGQVNVTHMVANYPGTGGEINGYMLMHHMTEQVKESGAKILQAAEITGLNLDNKEIEVDDDKRITADAIILATGAKPRELGLPGESEFFGRGISYCATCDGAFYEGKKIVVIGGGNTAVEESLYLTEFVEHITMVHQFDELQANKTAADQALAHPKIDILWSHEPRAFLGDSEYEKLEVEDLKTGEKKVLDQGEGVFVFVGYVPQTELFADQVELNDWGYVKTSELLETSRPGVFAAGDVRDKLYKQITVAVSDGTVAALQVQKYLADLKEKQKKKV
jgi:thioredoxin reductase (NADPH)